MAQGPRDYGSGTEKALFHLCSGTCYFPDCSTPVIRSVDGHQIVEVEIAHIRGANENSARYDPSMTDPERASFANLILMCTPHHKLIDRISPENYSVELLMSWKTTNEPVDGLQDLRNVVTETNFENLLERIAAEFAPTRTVELDLLVGLLSSPVDIASVPPDSFDMLLRTNPHLATMPRVIVSNIRNTGTLPVGVEAVDLYFGVATNHGSSEGEGSLTLMGRNDFGRSNPALPYRVKDGDAVRWLTRMETVQNVVETATLSGSSISSLWVRVRLATGETVDSVKVPWPFPDAWALETEPTVGSTERLETGENHD
jgi:hypothetical protein